MDRARGNVAAISHAIRFRFPTARQRHFAIENDVRGQTRMGVIGIERARTILPNVGVREPFREKLFPEFAFIQRSHVRCADYSRRGVGGRLRAERVCVVDPPASNCYYVGKISSATTVTTAARQAQAEAAEAAPDHP